MVKVPIHFARMRREAHLLAMAATRTDREMGRVGRLLFNLQPQERAHRLRV